MPRRSGARSAPTAWDAARLAWVEPRRIIRGERLVPVDPGADACLASLDAIRRRREAASREVSRLLRELRALRREPPAAGTDEPEPSAVIVPNEPEVPAAAHSHVRNEPDAPAPGPGPGDANARNEPESRPAAPPTPAERAEIEAMIASGEPDLILAAAARAGVLDQVAPLFAATAALAAAGRRPPPPFPPRAAQARRPATFRGRTLAGDA